MWTKSTPILEISHGGVAHDSALDTATLFNSILYYCCWKVHLYRGNHQVDTHGNFTGFELFVATETALLSHVMPHYELSFPCQCHNEDVGRKILHFKTM